SVRDRGRGLERNTRPSRAAVRRGRIHSVRGATFERARGACGDQNPARWEALGLMSAELRVLVADDEPAALTGLARRLAAMAGVRVVATCRNGVEALEQIRA